MKTVNQVVTILLVIICVITPFPILATTPAIINGQMDTSEPWIHWFSDQTWSFKGYPHNQQSGNTLGFDSYYYYDNSNLYLFISTDDNTAGTFNRDKFVVYFDIYPYGRGPEDIAYSIEAPTLLYDGGLKLHGPTWCDMDLYDGITTGSTNNELRTYEVAIPLSDLVPNKNNVNYRNAKFMIYLENYGDKLWGQHKVANYYPDSAESDNCHKKTSLWQPIDLTALCPGYFNPQTQQYSLTLTTNGGGSITSEPNQNSYVSGTNVQLTATPNAGCQFAGWSGDLTGTTNPASITMSSNKAVTATFTQIEYTLDVSVTAAGCSVNKSPNQATYHYGDVVTLTPIAGTGYTFSNWLGHLTGASSPATVTMNESKLVVANFVQSNYTLAVNYAGTGTGQVVTNASDYHYGDVAVLMAVADVGSEFSGWSGDATGNDNPAYVTVDGNMVATAFFNKQHSTLTVNTAGSGVVTKTPSLTAYDYGINVQLIATPAAGWSFAGWSGDLTGNANPASISVTGNMTVYAIFTQDQYTVALVASGQGNPTMTPNTAIVYGSTVQLNANPMAGWTFAGWSSNTPDIVIADPSQISTTAVINGPGTITATYTQNTYSLNVNVNPQQGGTVTVDNPGPYHYGDIVTLTETPAAGYTFGGWSGNAQGTGTTCAITIDGNKVVNANFEQTEYSISVVINPSAGGSVVADRNAPYHYGDVVTLTAQSNAGYSFSGWSGAASATTQSIQLTVTGNIDLTAQFTRNEYQLTVNIIGSGSVTKSSEGPYYYGDTVILSAHPSIGWSFVNWNESISSVANPFTLTIEENLTLNASFNQNYYTLNVGGMRGGYLILTPNQANYTYGTHIHIEAVANAGWNFERISWREVGGPIIESSLSTLDLIINCSTTVWSDYSPQACTLTIITTGNGTGAIHGHMSSFYALYGYHYSGTEITLEAILGADSVFTGWGQDLTGTTNPLTFTITKNTTVTANFISANKPPQLSLTPKTIVGPDPDIGDTIDVALTIENITNLWGWSISMQWNPSILRLVNVSEGSFLKFVGSTFFLVDNYSISEGILYELDQILLSDNGVNGTGNLAKLTFEIVGYGQTNITITRSELLSNRYSVLHLNILHTTQGATVSIAAPPVRSPTANFNPPRNGLCYVGDLVTLDASSSLPGYDTLPIGHETSNSITSYVWSIDFNNDGVIDQVLYGEVVDIVLPSVGIASITLTVTAPDSYAPTSSNYQQTTSVTKLIQVLQRPTKANIDIYTEFGGYFANMSSDAYAPQELVTVYGLVTYNDVPVVGKDVVFEIFSSDHSLFIYRSARTDDNGVASISFRVPWLDVDPESLMGNWTIIGNVDVSQVVVSDTCPFYFGYVVNTDSIITFDGTGSASSFARSGSINANVTVSNIRKTVMPAVVTLTIYDVSSVPIAVTSFIGSVNAESSLTVTVSLMVPSWAFVGVGKVYANVYVAFGDVPYCPEKTENIMITA